MLLVSSVLLIVAIANAIPLLEVEAEWSKFLEKFNPVYLDSNELQYRKLIFQENLKTIQKHNAEYDLGLHTYQMGVNQFADKTEVELSQSLSCLKSKALRDNIEKWPKDFRVPLGEKIPESIDWRQKGGVTPVKNQGYCGSCWAFAAVGALEGQYFRATNKLVSFSEQQLVDCSSSNGACVDGDPFWAYVDLMVMGGAATEESYPYKGKNGTCTFRPEMAVAKIHGVYISSGDEEFLKELVALVGPAVAEIQVTSKFQLYRTGVFYDDKCSQDLNYINHGVLIVGYGSENGTDYWLVKNSWGKHWGENGYIKMSRNRDNNCMISSDTMYPILV